LLPFPFEPDLSQPIVETFGYLTDVMVSENGTEQRVQLRVIPVGSINARILGIQPAHAQLLNALLHGHLTGPFAIGRWQFATPLIDDAEQGDTAIHCNTEQIPFEVHGLVLIWSDPLHYELRVVSYLEAELIQLDAGIVEDEEITGVQQGSSYPLLHSGVMDVSVTGPSGTPEYDLTDDYTVDAWTGRIYIVPGGAIENDSGLEISYVYGAVANNWQAGQTYIMPAVVGRLSKSESVNWESLIVSSEDVTFDLDGFTP
jgi:hypothetical protein